jgi:hypothetical protein
MTLPLDMRRLMERPDKRAGGVERLDESRIEVS